MSLSLSLLAFTSMSLFLRLLLPHTPHMHYFKGKKFKIAKTQTTYPKVNRNKQGFVSRKFPELFAPEIKYLNQNLKKQANRPRVTFSPYVPIPFRLARFSIAPVGSDPMERKHMSGVLGLLSSQVASRFRITPSAYLSPMVSAIYLRA